MHSSLIWAFRWSISKSFLRLRLLTFAIYNEWIKKKKKKKKTKKKRVKKKFAKTVKIKFETFVFLHLKNLNLFSFLKNFKQKQTKAELSGYCIKVINHSKVRKVMRQFYVCIVYLFQLNFFYKHHTTFRLTNKIIYLF